MFCMSYTQFYIGALDVVFDEVSRVSVGWQRHRWWPIASRVTPGCCSRKCTSMKYTCMKCTLFLTRCPFPPLWDRGGQTSHKLWKKKASVTQNYGNHLWDFFTFPGCRRFIFVLLSSSAFTSSELETCPQNAHGTGWVAATRIHFIHKAVFTNAQGILNLSKSKSKVQIKLHLVPRSLDSQKSVWSVLVNWRLVFRPQKWKNLQKL